MQNVVLYNEVSFCPGYNFYFITQGRDVAGVGQKFYKVQLDPKTWEKLHGISVDGTATPHPNQKSTCIKNHAQLKNGILAGTVRSMKKIPPVLLEMENDPENLARILQQGSLIKVVVMYIDKSLICKKW